MTINTTSKISTRNLNLHIDPALSLADGIDMHKLIGHSHLYGRMCETRHGFMIVPIGNMILQPDGRITGYNHPNEGLWKPYEFSNVSANEAFAFVGADNKFIPSSTWQQTYAEMPVGFYCGEPEMPQKLCLIPNNNVSHYRRIIYVIASCSKFYKATVPHLISELLEEGIEPYRIKVVVNDCSKNEELEIENVSYVFTKHNAWELSALFEAPLHWSFDYAMLIHDTNQIFPGFKRRVENFNTHIFWDHLPATPLARCLLGLYSDKFLLRINDWLRTLDGIDKKNAIIAEVAGELLLRSKTILVMGDLESNGAARSVEWRETADFFNTGTLRVRRVFPTLNLHKFTHTSLANPGDL